MNARRRRRPAAGEEKQAEKKFEGENETERTFAHGHLPLSHRTVSCNPWCPCLMLMLLIPIMIFPGMGALEKIRIMIRIMSKTMSIASCGGCFYDACVSEPERSLP